VTHIPTNLSMPTRTLATVGAIALGTIALSLVSVVQAQDSLGVTGRPRVDTVARPSLPARAEAPMPHDSVCDSACGQHALHSPGSSLHDAEDEYRRTGVARTIQEGTVLAVPYGHAQPTLTCAPLRVCTIELDSGEVILDKLAGDTQRWEIVQARAGAYGETPLVAIKPHDCGIATNLVLTTSTATGRARVYEITLDSPPCARGTMNPAGPYVRQLRYWYPDDLIAAWARPAVIHPADTPAPSIAASIPLDRLNFDYRVRRDKHFPWAPRVVFDDGAHLYLTLPDAAVHDVAPVLFALADDGTKTLINYVVHGTTYVTDRVARRAVLVIGEGSDIRTLTLENRRAAASTGDPDD